MEIKKKYVFMVGGIVVFGALFLIPRPHHHHATPSKTPVSSTVSVTNSSKSTTKANAPTDNTVNAVVNTANSTNSTANAQTNNTVQTASDPKNVASDVAQLLGTSTITVGIKANAQQALDGAYLNKLCQLVVQNSKGAIEYGPFMVPIKYSDGVLVVSIKKESLANVRSDTAQNWFLVSGDAK